MSKHSSLKDRSQLQAGAAKVDITPKIGCWLEGIPRAQPSDAIHDPLYSRALVAERQGTRICLVTFDLIRLSTEYSNDLRADIGQALGMNPDAVVLAAAHNHSGPATMAIRDGAGHLDQEYLGLLASKLLMVSQEAAYRMEPALLGVGLGKENTVSEYRRLVTKDGNIVMNWEDHSPEDIVGPAEEGDPGLGVVQLISEDGQVIAVVFNYACHANSLPGTTFTITSDFPGFASNMIEKNLGGLALFTNGAQGSVDIEGFEGRDFGGVERRGRALGQAVLDVCRDIAIDPDPVIRSVVQAYHIPWRQVPPDTLAWAQRVNAQASGEKVTLRDGISDEIMAVNILRHIERKDSGVDFKMVGIRLGELVFLTIAGELFTEVGKRMKSLSDSLQVHVIGVANGYHGYIPTAKASVEGGYACGVESGAYLAENADGIICQNAEIVLQSLQ